jgi:yecA family protein
MNAERSRVQRDELFEKIKALSQDSPVGGNAACLHGFMTAIASGPPVLPSEWMPVVLGDSEQIRMRSPLAVRAMELLMCAFNEVVHDLGSVDPLAGLEIGDQWCKGYRLGTSLRPVQWLRAMNAREIADFFVPIFAVADGHGDSIKPLPSNAVLICRWWRKQLVKEPRMSLNGACPCGSGKKSRHCCSNPNEGA